MSYSAWLVRRALPPPLEKACAARKQAGHPKGPDLCNWTRPSSSPFDTKGLSPVLRPIDSRWPSASRMFLKQELASEIEAGMRPASLYELFDFLHLHLPSGLERLRTQGKMTNELTKWTAPKHFRQIGLSLPPKSSSFRASPVQEGLQP